MAKLSDLNKVIRDALNKVVGQLNDSIGKNGAKQVGEAMIVEMKSLISKGISPIGKGGSGKKFPAYKAVKSALSRKSKKKKSTKKKGYPYSVQKQYPSKKAQPVNLKLSGEFLDDIIVESISKDKKGLKLDLGFSKQINRDKEEGHREGANGQPKRPIITLPSEEYGQKMKLAGEEVLKKILKNFKLK